MIKRAIIASTVDHDYSFLAVIAALLWRDRIGFTPSMFLVGTEAEWVTHKYGRVVMGAISQHSIHHVFVDHQEGVLDKTVAQCCRQYAACHPFAADDYLISTDADLLPIKKDFYHFHNPKAHAIGLWYANAYIGEEEFHWPSCHYGMLVSTWREVMGLEVGKMPENMVLNFAEYGLPEKMAAWNAEIERAHAAGAPADAKHFWPVWFTDELVASAKIKTSQYYPDRVLKINRDGHPPKDRLDRSAWPFYVDVNRYTDSHSLRPGWSSPNWPRLAPFLKKILPAHEKWLDQYRADFRDAIGVDA